MHLYIYTHEQSQNSPTHNNNNKKYNRLTQWTKEIKNYIYELRTKLASLKNKVENKTKSKVPSGE